MTVATLKAPRATVVHEVAAAIRVEVDGARVRSVHWHDAWLSLKLLDERPQDAVVETVGPVTEWRRGDRCARFYRVAGWEDGGFEFEVELAAPPVSNVLEFELRSKGLDFHYQPALTPAEVADGACRPEEMVGSYAVYRSAGGGHRLGGWNYRAGKAMHIPRPWAEDASGTRVWCDMLIDAGRLTITIPPDFLAAAVYPVLVDPTFGYTTVGSSSAAQTSSSKSIAVLATYAATAGDTVTKFTCYTDDGGSGNGTTVADMAAYTVTSSLPAARLAAGVTLAPAGSGAWQDTAPVSQVMAAATYCVAVGNYNAGGGSLGVYYDVTGATNFRSLHTTAGALPASWTDDGSTSTRHHSMYATYTAGAAPGTFGTTSGAGTSAGGLNDIILGTKYTMPAGGGIVSKVSVFAKGTGNIKAALFTDNAGSPDQLIVASGAGVAVTAGSFFDITIGPIWLPAGTYWQVTREDQPSLRGFVAGGSNQAAYNLTSLPYANAWPTTFPTPSFQSNDYVMYATYAAPPTPLTHPMIGPGQAAARAASW